MIKFFLITSTVYFSVLINASSISFDIFNNALKKDYSFVERSLSKSDLKIESSSGKIILGRNGIIINVLAPFEETYTISDGTLEIHDLFLDQKQMIDLSQTDNFFLNILINGIDENGSPISLADFKGKNVILYFYPKDMTPGCTTQSCNLRDSYSDLTQKGFDVIGVSADSQKKNPVYH